MVAPSRPKDTSALALATSGAAGASPLEAGRRSFTSNFLGVIAGRADSADALKKLAQDISNQKRSAARPLLMRASRAMNSGDYASAKQLALEALKKDEHSGFGWYILGMALDSSGDFANSIRAYEAALKLLPNHEELANDLGRLALRLNMLPQAEKLFWRHLESHPGSVEVVNNLAACLRQMGRYQEAVDVLRPAIVENQDSALLWNSMGGIMADMGDVANAQVFFAEAIRLDPNFYRAHHNVAHMSYLAGDAGTALIHADKALEGATLPSDKAMTRMVRFNALANLGRLSEAWDEYDVRLDKHFSTCTLFAINEPIWTPGDDIRGKTLLVIGEQGLGDEILFGTLLPDVLRDLGPDGKMLISVERRLVELFQRSFPDAIVGTHRTGMVEGRATRIPVFEESQPFDTWVPMASLLRGYRTTQESFSDRTHIFKPDPERVAHWRTMLERAPKGPKVGILWKSGSTAGARHRFFSPLERWRPILTTPGVTFVNLQYDDCSEEIAYFKKEMGVDVWDPPEIDLKQDLEGVAALSSACDLVIGFSNATFNIAASCGTPSWLISTLGAWPRLGRDDTYAWYPQTRMFGQRTFGEWDETMARVGEALREWVGERAAA